jgi:GTP pyrophosphokinase
LEKIYDVVAMMLITDTEENCYLIDDLLKQWWQAVPDSQDDYIQKPRPSGYKSLHEIFETDKDTFLEVQIKTKKMHENNEYGFASHAFYKIGETLKKKLKKDPEWLREINFDLNKERVKIDQFSKNVYVFTPKGNIIELPEGACLIDFAYAIHDDIGNRCVGGLVNGEMQKLTYKVKNGDRIEIKTQKSRSKPSADWEKIAKTKKAQMAIKKALKEE